MKLTPSQVDFFRTEGYLALPDLFPAEHAAALRERLEGLCAEWEGEAARRAGVQQEPEVRNREGEGPSARTVRKFAGLADTEDLFLAHARSPQLVSVIE